MRIAYVCADRGVPVFGRKGCSIHVQEMIRAFRASAPPSSYSRPGRKTSPPRDWMMSRFTAFLSSITKCAPVGSRWPWPPITIFAPPWNGTARSIWFTSAIRFGVLPEWRWQEPGMCPAYWR